MPDNSKGELIKKKDSTPSKKVVVVKKVKKVIIKKQQPVDKKENDKPNKVSENKTPGPKKIIHKKDPGKKDIKFTPGKKQMPVDTTPPTDGDRTKHKKHVNKKQDYKDKHIQKQQKEQEKRLYTPRKRQENQTSSIPDQVDIMDVISISDLAKKMNIKANLLIAKLMEMGTMVTINDGIDSDTAEILCSEFNCKVNVVSLYDETVIDEEKDVSDDLIKRPPVVTVMGHVDHGKTKLLDAIRSTDVVAGESGGITQHIGAYSVIPPGKEKITFIDTPGHQAFTMMRARGAQITDIVVLVVAADDGVMPQTKEAIQHAQAAKVPIIVAVNKIDKEGANIERTKQQLSDYDLLPEEWGGSTLYCEVSALKKTGIDNLLDTILLQAEMLDLKASTKVRAKGFVIESQIDQGRGAVATILVQKGTLKIGDFFVAGVFSGKVRAMYDDRGNRVKSVGPSSPIELTGIESVPSAGDPFNVTATEKEAKMFAQKRQELKRIERSKSVKKVTLKDFLAKKVDGEQQEIKVIIKADVQGSVEAIKDSLEKLSNVEVKLTTVGSGVGGINEGDIHLAIASQAFVIGFHVRPNPRAAELADKENIEIKRYNIIYDVIEDIKASMEGMIKPELSEELIGNVEVKKVFKISKVGVVAGCLVTEGKVTRKALIRLIRDDVEIYSGKITTLKRFKDEASEVLAGQECGIAIEKYTNIKVGDIMEAYQIKEIARGLKDVKAAPEPEEETEVEATDSDE
jgi:translation initiation factor IF-2